MRSGNWIQTYTGRKFYPLDPRPEDVDISDIAHALSLTCRYGGHCRKFYSVAEHSILIARELPPHLKFEGLLHDAAEAYLCDLPSPVKRTIPDFAIAENKIDAAIRKRFGLFDEESKIVKSYDTRILVDEMKALMPSVELDYEPLNVRIEGLAPPIAEGLFLSMFEKLKGKVSA